MQKKMFVTSKGSWGASSGNILGLHCWMFTLSDLVTFYIHILSNFYFWFSSSFSLLNQFSNHCHFKKVCNAVMYFIIKWLFCYKFWCMFRVPRQRQLNDVKYKRTYFKHYCALQYFILMYFYVGLRVKVIMISKSYCT